MYIITVSVPQPFMYAFILKPFNIENSNDIVPPTNTVSSCELQSSELSREKRKKKQPQTLIIITSITTTFILE